MATTEEIITGLEHAEKTFNRDPILGIYTFYLEFLETGDYPYLVHVVKYILERVDIPEHLHKQLQTEIYLASQQRDGEILAKRAEEMRENGFVQADQDNLVEGKKYILSNITKTKQQEVKCMVFDGSFCLMPVRNRVNAIRVNGQWVKEVPTQKEGEK